MNFDPDVEQAIEDLGPAAQRLRMVNDQLRIIDPVMQYRQHIGARAEAQQCRDLIILRAKKLLVSPGAMLFLVDLDVRLRSRIQRKPSRQQMVVALGDGIKAAQQRRDDAATALVVAQAEDAASARDLDAAQAALNAFGGRP